jgi:uncharacterized protein YdhG (YjbR/CyaY superfamily)
MSPVMKQVNSIDEYISSYPKNIQVLLEKMRQTIKKAAPGAEEAIRYGIPTFRLNGNLVHFGGFKNHIGFYPTPAGISAFEKELASYEKSKGAIKFPLDQPIPFDLVTKIVQLRVKEVLARRK